MTNLTDDKIFKLLERYWNDPEYYFKTALGVQKLYPKQIEIAESVRDNRHTAVVGCNSSGKDFMSGRIIPWWITCKYPAKVTVLGPTAKQVNGIVFDEFRSAINNAPSSFRGQMYRQPMYRLNENHNVVGYSTDNPQSITGRHSPHGLIIVTEAHHEDLSEEDFKMLRTLTYERWLMTGNPFAESGDFYDAFHSKSDIYNTISISSFDTPNVIEDKVVIPGLVTRQGIEDRKREYGEDSPYYIASVLGRFPDSSEDAIIPLSYIRTAMEREIPEDYNSEGPIIMGVDVARKGEDKTVIIIRQGNVAKIVHEVQGKRTTETAGFILNLTSEYPVDYIVIDDAGVGGGVSDILHDAQMDGKLALTSLIEFNGGSRPTQTDRFADRNSEIWWAMRQWFMSMGVYMQYNEQLQSECVGRKYSYTGKGQIKLEPKEKLKKSPDYADSLAMTFEPELGSSGYLDLDDEGLEGKNKWNVGSSGSYSFPGQDDRGSGDREWDSMIADFGPTSGSKWNM